MTATKKNLVINQGATFSHDFIALNTNGEVIDLTQYGIESQIRVEFDSTSATANFTASVVDASAGKINLSLTSSQTEVLEDGKYVYDVKAYDADGNVSRLLQGIITVYPEATR